MHRRTVSGMLLALLAIALFVPIRNICPVWTTGMIYIRAEGSIDPPDARAIVVPIDYPTIQEAINAANAGDTIFVEAGTYYENVVVNRTVLLSGENRDSTIIDANGTGTIVSVMASNVTIEGFTLQDSGEWEVGINIRDCDRVTIRNNNIMGNGQGIWLFGSSDSLISGNNLTRNRSYGILCSYSWGTYGVVPSSNNTIIGNDVKGNRVGISLNYAPLTKLRDNHMSGNELNFGVGDYEKLGLWEYSQDMDSSNTVDGKPVYYLVNEKNLTVPVDAGYVALVNSTNITVQNLNLRNNSQGLLIAYTTNSFIVGNNITNNGYGIRIEESSNNAVSGNNITDNSYGFWFSHSFGNNVSGNNITKNGDSMWFSDSSDNNFVSGNNIIDNGVGIKLYASSNNTLRNNHMSDDQWNFAFWAFLPSHYFHDIDSSNTVDGKPVYYLVNEKNLTVPVDAGYVALVNSTNITVQNLNLKNNTLLVAYTTNSLIADNTITNSYFGVEFESSSDNAISGNNITANSGEGVLLVDSSNNSISGNNITENEGYGIRLSGASGQNSVSGNNIAENSEGIHFSGEWMTGSPNNNTIVGNNITNSWYGVYLFRSSYNSISGNNIADNSIGVSCSSSSGNTFSGNNVANNGNGIMLDSSSDNVLCGNNVTANHWSGVQLSSSSGNTLSDNNLMANNGYGIYLYSSSDNMFCHNNFMANTQQVTSESSANVWDDGYPSGGNYWSDYNGTDANHDNIGDTPYIINENNTDYYPLMKPYTRLLGDINEDDRVDMRDVGYVARRFMCVPGDELWDPIADMNGDSKINMMDIGTVARHFGEHYP